MDNATMQTTAPSLTLQIQFAVPPQIENGTTHPFLITEYELEILTKEWFSEVKCVWNKANYYGLSGSTESQLLTYVNNRLPQIAEILGWDRVMKCCEAVDEERFVTALVQVSPATETTANGDQAAQEKQPLYTDDCHCIVFHRSEVGVRHLPGRIRGPGPLDVCPDDPSLVLRNRLPERKGWQGDWCWQFAGDYKTIKPVKHCGFRTAKAALEAAEKWENVYKSRKGMALRGRLD